MIDGTCKYLCRFRREKKGMAPLFTSPPEEFSALLTIDAGVVSRDEYIAVRLQAEKVAGQDMGELRRLFRVRCYRVEKLQSDGRWVPIRFPVPQPLTAAIVADDYEPSTERLETWPE